MCMSGFFDLEERFTKLDGLRDPLVKIEEVVNWEGFRSALTHAFSKPRKSNAGRKEWTCPVSVDIWSTPGRRRCKWDEYPARSPDIA